MGKKHNWRSKLSYLHEAAEKPAIGLVVTGFDKGGLEQVVFNLYAGYRRAGHEAYILCENPALAGYFAKQLYDLRHLRIFCADEEDFLSFCAKKRIRVLHYHYNTFLMHEAKMLGFKTYYTIHNVYTWMTDEDFAERVNQTSLCDGVVAVSTFVKNYYCERGLLPQNKVQVISNGIDFVELDIDELPKGLETRAALKLAPGDKTIAQISSFNAVKHQIGMVGVMEKLIKTHPEVKLLFVGNVIEQDYYEDVLNVIRSSPAKDHIIFVPFFSHRHMGAFLRAHVDIFTLPTIQEGCSNAVLEAIYCRKPMVLTDVGNARDVQNETACVVAKTAYGDPINLKHSDIAVYARQKDAANRDSLCGAFGAVLEQFDTYEAKARQVPAEWIETLSVTQMVGQYLNLFFA